MTPKQRAYTTLKKSYAARAEMAKYTNRAIAKRYGQTIGMVSDMRSGHDPVKMPDSIKRKIRLDLMRHGEAAKYYISLDAMAEQLEVSRSTIRKWAREFGFANEGQEQKRKPRPAKPVELLWPGTPMGKFAVMKLSLSPSGMRTYY